MIFDRCKEFLFSIVSFSLAKSRTHGACAGSDKFGSAPDGGNGAGAASSFVRHQNLYHPYIYFEN